MTIDEARNHGAHLWMDKSDDSLRAAHHGIIVSPAFSVNRAYFASFYGVCALLPFNGLPPTKRRGAMPSSHKRLVETGKLSKELGMAYKELVRLRRKADYEIGIQWTTQQAGEVIAMAERIIAAIRAKLVS